jgi:purine-binding chemotaxis protein CheW
MTAAGTGAAFSDRARLPDRAGLVERAAIEGVLAERARLLARRPEVVSAVPMAQLLAFAAGNERYALDVTYVYRLERCARITPLPGAARQFTGIVNVHGQIVPLVDLGVLLGTPPCLDPTFAIILGDARAEIGIVAQALIEMREIPLDTLASSTPAPRPLVRHITADGIAVIDGAAMIADPRLTHEENVR